MNFFKYFFFFFVFFLLSCGEGNGRQTRRGLYPPLPDRDRRIDRRGGFQTRDQRATEIRRLKGDKVISAELDHRFDGGYYYEGYDGEECQESGACMDICDSELGYKNRHSCYKAPKALIMKLEDGFYDLLTISELDSVNISPGLLGGMLDINVDLVADLVEENMSEGDLKSFLAWVAVKEDIAEVFLKEDRRSEVMEKAFEKLGELLHPDARESRETGLNVGLIDDEDSFFHLSALENNEAAFQIGYEVLESLCRTRDCKLDLLCARELKTRTRSRFSGYKDSLIRCSTSAEQGRRTRREALCYIHGAASWSFLDELIEDDEIRDSDFRDETDKITVEICNTYCGDTNSGKCERVR